MSTLSQRLAKLDAVERRKAMDERNAKRRAEYAVGARDRAPCAPPPAVRPKVLLWDGEPIDLDFDDLCNWYNSYVLPRKSP